MARRSLESKPERKEKRTQTRRMTVPGAAMTNRRVLRVKVRVNPYQSAVPAVVVGVTPRRRRHQPAAAAVPASHHLHQSHHQQHQMSRVIHQS